MKATPDNLRDALARAEDSGQQEPIENGRGYKIGTRGPDILLIYPNGGGHAVADAEDWAASVAEIINKTISTPEEYASREGVSCPVCRTNNIEGCGSVDIDCGGAFQDVQCLECGATWTDSYTLTRYLDLKDKDGKELQPD